MQVNKVKKVNIKMNQTTHKIINEKMIECANLYNRIMLLHKYIRKRWFNNKEKWKWPSWVSMDKHIKNTKNGKIIYNLDSRIIQVIIKDFYARIKTTQTVKKEAKKKDIDCTARFPHKLAIKLPIPIRSDAIKKIGDKLKITLAKNQYLMFDDIGKKVVKIQLRHNLIEYTFTDDVDIPIYDHEKYAGCDIGLIHTATLTDGEKALVIVGRGIRSKVQSFNKRIAKLSRKIKLCKEKSKNKKYLNKRQYKIRQYMKNFRSTYYHTVSTKIVNWCIENDVTSLVIGDLAGITHKKRGKRSKRLNQEMSNLNFGMLYNYLNYKLEEKGIKFIKIKEHYTTQTCPNCGQRHKPKGRNYICKCGYKQHRDVVGAINIMRKYMGEQKISYSVCKNINIKYLRPIKLGRSSMPRSRAKVTV